MMTKSAGSRPAGLLGGRLGPGRCDGGGSYCSTVPGPTANTHRETDTAGTAWYHNTRQRIIEKDGSERQADLDR